MRSRACDGARTAIELATTLSEETYRANNSANVTHVPACQSPSPGRTACGGLGHGIPRRQENGLHDHRQFSRRKGHASATSARSSRPTSRVTRPTTRSRSSAGSTRSSFSGTAAAGGSRRWHGTPSGPTTRCRPNTCRRPNPDGRRRRRRHFGREVLKRPAYCPYPSSTSFSAGMKRIAAEFMQ